MSKNVNEENMGSSPADPVMVIQAMGRKIGYIHAAARLADPKKKTPLQIYLTESKLTIDELVDKINDQLVKDGNGWMATILREPGLIYNAKYDKVPLQKVALSERFFHEKWIEKNRVDVSDEFLKYVRPLIGEDWISVPMINGKQRFTQFKPIFTDKKLPEYNLEAL